MLLDVLYFVRMAPKILFIGECFHQVTVVISNAFCVKGAGSCMEVLAAKKPLVVVINEDLMDNHQLELAQQLYNDGHVFYSTCRSDSCLSFILQLFKKIFD